MYKRQIRERPLEVVAAGDDLLARGPEEDRVLVLGNVGALDVAEGRVGLDDADVAEVLERAEVLLLLGARRAVDRGGAAVVALEPAAAEGERAEGLVDVREELLGPGHAQGHVGRVEVLHVVGALEVLDDVAAARGAERLDRVELALLHARRVAALDDWHTFARVDLVRAHGVAI